MTDCPFCTTGVDGNIALRRLAELDELLDYGKGILERRPHESCGGAEPYQPDRRIGDYVLAGIALLEFCEKDMEDER